MPTTHSQSLQSLERANEVRITRGKLWQGSKPRVQEPEYMISLLEQRHWALESISISSFMTHTAKWGPRRVRTALKKQFISESRKLRDLTDNERARIIELLRSKSIEEEK